MKATKTIKSSNLFPVVGIGASAGGLDAFKKLIKAIPENSGIAFVLVQHLDPSHESMLPELLQKVTSIPVLEISDDIKVEPNHIYVIPSNKMMVANDGVLILTLRPAINKGNRNLPIDLFFTSLAEVHQSHAIGVVLSGSASDGTAGLKAIKDHGGITFAQDNESASFESMPNSAVKAGVVDFVLPPEEIPGRILEIIQSINNHENILPQEDVEIIKKIISLLRIRKGTDFTYYKQTTIRRRILRRMVLNKNENLASYLNYLKENKPEQDILYQDLLIPVTTFFRDEKVFDNLCETVFPNIVKNKIGEEPIRVWIAGCSTGEEAYSIAICLKEFLGDIYEKVQIFATDLSEPAILKARNGVYATKDLDTVSPQRLKTFFTKTSNGYKVNKQIRDVCIFAVHNFLKDPPFGRMDFISCRNVLIYMEPYLQKKALTTFHYALKPKGILLLGKSETTSSVPDFFVSTGKNDKLFSRKDVPGKFSYSTSHKSEKSINNIDTAQKTDNISNDFQKTADEIMLNKYTPAGVIVNEAMDIIHFRGNTSKYLEQLAGKPSHNLLKLAKQSLGFELRNLIHKAKKELSADIHEEHSIKKDNIRLESDSSIQYISIEVIPLPNTIEPYYLILFQDNNTFTVKKTSAKTKKDEKDVRIQQLEKELAQTHEDMRSITEDQEATNEELQSDNEELLSSSEELQSLNEELETSKEELQSTNEELLVVNQEIINLNVQVTEARDYSEAIVATIHEPMIILDKDLRVKSANKAFYKNFRVSESETKGMLLYDLGNKQWNIPGLRELLENIIPKNSHFYDYEINHNFPDIGERIMLLNASRLIQESQGEQLILLAIHDVTEIRKKIHELQHIEKELLKKDIGERKAEKEKLEKAVAERTAELTKVNKELINQYIDKEKLAGELIIANKELVNQYMEKEKRAAELIIANNELILQIEEKEKFANELTIANKELESFAYVSSHDLQEPLRKIQTYVDRIRDKENKNLSESGKDYLLRMQLAAERMQQLIIDLLAFSRINRTDRKLEMTELNEIMDDVKNELKDIIEEKHAIVEVAKLCPAKIIPFQFRQLMNNLISNALKFSVHETPPHIVINSCIEKGKILMNENSSLNNDRLSPHKNYCHISVSDNGIGFDSIYNERIFEVFQRLHGKEKYKGTGIGLAIVKKIIDNHHGIITARGELNKGATFDIYIPAS